MYRLDYIAMKGQSKKTEEAYMAACAQLINRFSDIPITDLTFDDVRDWKIWLDKGRTPNTVRNYIINLRSVLRFLGRKNIPVLHPDNIPVPKREQKEMKYLNESEAREFIKIFARKSRGYSNANRLRNIAIGELLYATGLRNSELCSLNRDSIKNRTFTIIGKGSKPRIGFVDEGTLEIIGNYMSIRDDSNRAMFVSNQTKKRITPGTIRRIFESACAHSSYFNGVHPHTMRHSHATKLLVNRVDIRYVKEFMGHANLNTTAMYTHVVNEELREIYDHVYS